MNTWDYVSREISPIFDTIIEGALYLKDTQAKLRNLEQNT